VNSQPLACVLSIALIALASCGDNTPPQSSVTQTVNEPDKPAPAPAQAVDERLPTNVAALLKPWTGDLDGMVERRLIRVLTVNSKTIYFVDKGVLRGTAIDYGRLFEQELNKKLSSEKKLNNKNLKVQVVFIPVQRDQLLPALAAGKGDIAAASLTITPERQRLVDFTAAGMSNVNEVVVSGPASPSIASLDDLSGKTVFVRKSSSYFENLVALNKTFNSRRPPKRSKTRTC
jgi:ABC-type amino acid transport substrate-binding protein